MALEEYVRKRKFEKTPEPAPKTQPETNVSGAALRFFVQRHDATRLHYDFRLEIGGVLVSWAVPKGPTLEPLAKHLAAKVEDHPLDYGDFEGNIPAGNYGAGSVMLWDRGTWELAGDKPLNEQLARGDLKFRLDGEKIHGEFALVHMKNRGKGNEWLMIKKRDADAVQGWDIEQHAWSVLSGRTQQEIAQGLPARKTMQETAGDPQREWKSKPARRAAAPAAKATAAPAKKAATIDPAKLKGAVAAAMPAAITPMKAELADKPPQGDEWLFEVKWDGVRAICFIDKETVRLVSRTGHSCEKQYPELSVISHYIAADQAVIDGEIAVLDDKGAAHFELIQPRIAQTDPNAVAHLARSRPVIYFVFDLLYLDGYDLRQVALAERKRALEAILTPALALRYSQHFPGAGAALLEAAREQGLEGILAKRANSCYESRRSRDWLKLKIVERQEFVICGFTVGERDPFGALVLGVYEQGKLVWVGNVGTGFDNRTLAFLRQKLDPLVTPESPFPDNPKVAREVIYVQPELVAEVKFANWTGDGKLRAPVYLGLRPDAAARDCVREVADAEPEAKQKDPLLATKQAEVQLKINDRPLKFTNLNKIFYPAEGVTKRDLLNYYDSVADLILPHLRDRPLSLKRYPNGIEQAYFFQKDAPLTFAPWLRTEEIFSDHNDGTIRYVFAGDRASLLYLVNLGCIDHNPWMSRSQSLDNPDFVLIDLDPQECSYDRIVEAALLVREKLEAIGMEGYPKTTGGDGMHIYIPLEPVYSYEESRTFAEILAHAVQRARPALFTTPRAVAKREKGRVYFDYLQNGKSKTIAAPYVLRAYPGAPVATPLAWREVKPGLTPAQFNIHNAPERFAKLGDLFEPVLTNLQRLEEPLEKLDALLRNSG